MGKGTWATLVFLGVFILFVVYRSATISEYECDVCLTFQGSSVCRTAASGTRETAVESATTACCGTLASGMTESIRCQNTPPDKVECRQE